MSEALIREITHQIIREQLLQNWEFYLVLIAAFAVASVVSAFIGSYIRKRGETYATKADLNELLTQLRATTKAAEEVKTVIAHTDWVMKEWKTIRRTKLEELFSSVYALREWVDKETRIRLFDANADDRPSPIWRIELVSRLYFPELHAEVQALSILYSEYCLTLISIQIEIMNAKNENNLQSHKAAYDAGMQRIMSHHKNLLKVTQAFEAMAPAVMKEIAGV